MDEESPEKEFQAQELNKIDEFPDNEHRANIRIAVIYLEERVFCRESRR